MNSRTKPDAEPTLGVLTGVLGFHLAQATVATDVSFRATVGEPFGLRKVEFSLMMMLLANGPLAPKSIAVMLNLSGPNLTLQLDRMTERGLLSRVQNPHDGRSQHIVLTGSGMRLARKAAAAARSLESTLDARLSAAEHAMLIELLSKLSGRRKADVAKTRPAMERQARERRAR